MSADPVLELLHVINHEASHVACAILKGLRVKRIVVDGTERSGAAFGGFRPGDPRSAAEKGRARAVIAAIGPIAFPVADPRREGADRQQAEQWARLAGLPLADVVDEAAEVTETAEFKRLVGAVSGEMMDAPGGTLRETDLDRILEDFDHAAGAAVQTPRPSPAARDQAAPSPDLPDGGEPMLSDNGGAATHDGTEPPA